MRLRPTQSRQRGVVSVEAAIVLPVAFLMIIGMLVGAAGVFRYQQVAAVAREATRWASVHGATWSKDMNKPTTTAADVYNNAIKPNLVAMNLSDVTYSVTWQSGGKPPNDTTVTVTLTYKWVPEAYFFGPYNLTSPSTSAVTY
jgi:Flp pilus assembly protein TadG